MKSSAGNCPRYTRRLGLDLAVLDAGAFRKRWPGKQPGYWVGGQASLPPAPNPRWRSWHRRSRAPQRRSTNQVRPRSALRAHLLSRVFNRHLDQHIRRQAAEPMRRDGNRRGGRLSRDIQKHSTVTGMFRGPVVWGVRHGWPADVSSSLTGETDQAAQPHGIRPEEARLYPAAGALWLVSPSLQLALRQAQHQASSGAHKPAGALQALGVSPLNRGEVARSGSRLSHCRRQGRTDMSYQVHPRHRQPVATPDSRNDGTRSQRLAKPNRPRQTSSEDPAKRRAGTNTRLHYDPAAKPVEQTRAGPANRSKQGHR